MIREALSTTVGREASDVLRQVIRARQHGDALARVTVLVPSNLAALALRRLMGADGAGVANLDVVTLPTLVDRLAAGLVDGPPMTPAMLGAAVRRALAEVPGRFAPVARHPATEEAAVSLYAELSAVGAEARAALASHGGRAGREAVALFDAIAARCGASVDLAAAADAVAAAHDLDRRAARLGHLVWFLPEPVGNRVLAVVRRLLDTVDSTVVVGWCGDPEADRSVAAVCLAAGVAVEPPAAVAPDAARILSASDADDEVRAVLREVTRLLAEGIEPSRIGIVHPAPVPYARILQQQLRAAGIPASGPATQRLADSVAGRTLLAAIALPAERWRRDRVLAFVSDAPVADGERPAPAAAWEVLSRRAGVVAGLADWQAKLDAHRHARERWAEWTGDDPSTDPDIAECLRLSAFVLALSDDLSSIRSAGSWSSRSAAAIAMLDRLFGPNPPGWPESEAQSLAAVRAALDRVGQLDEFEPDATVAEFERAIAAELDAPTARDGRFGSGVLHGHLSTVIGVDLDAVFVLGAVEGLLPHGRRDDALLPDRARAATGGALPTRSERTAEQRRRYLTALAAAPQERRWVSLPRSDLRSNRRTVPSRWIAESPATVTMVHSHAAGVLHSVAPPGLAELDASAALRWHADGLDVVGHPAVGDAARGITAQRARRSAVFSEWDGFLGEAAVPASTDTTWSPTELETWAACGMRHLFQYVLGVRDRDDPDSIVELQPLDRGAVLHTVLERFVAEAMEAGEPERGRAWDERWRSRIVAIAEEEFAAIERRGRTGRDLAWQVTRDDLLADLLDFVDRDDVHRSAGWQPVAVEWGFGTSEVPPARFDLGDGRAITFRGRVDRIDRMPDGRTMVIDYKSGRSSTRARDDDPVQAGTRLQLGVYARAATQVLGGGDVSTMYWPVRAGDRADDARTWSADDQQRLDEVVRASVDGIEAGVHPAVPGDWSIFRNTYEHCVHCPYDGICPRDRGEQAGTKADAPELAVRRALLAEEPA